MTDLSKKGEKKAKKKKKKKGKRKRKNGKRSRESETNGKFILAGKKGNKKEKNVSHRSLYYILPLPLGGGHLWTCLPHITLVTVSPPNICLGWHDKLFTVCHLFAIVTSSSSLLVRQQLCFFGVFIIGEYVLTNFFEKTFWAFLLRLLYESSYFSESTPLLSLKRFLPPKQRQVLEDEPSGCDDDGWRRRRCRRKDSKWVTKDATDWRRP